MVENIVECIDKSRKFLLVLSDSFLQSQWSQFETHVAITQMVENDRSGRQTHLLGWHGEW